MTNCEVGQTCKYRILLSGSRLLIFNTVLYTQNKNAGSYYISLSGLVKLIFQSINTTSSYALISCNLCGLDSLKNKNKMDRPASPPCFTIKFVAAAAVVFPPPHLLLVGLTVHSADTVLCYSASSDQFLRPDYQHKSYMKIIISLFMRLQTEGKHNTILFYQ